LSSSWEFGLPTQLKLPVVDIRIYYLIEPVHLKGKVRR
jgi:hypothetical protein